MTVTARRPTGRLLQERHRPRGPPDTARKIANRKEDDSARRKLAPRSTFHDLESGVDQTTLVEEPGDELAEQVRLFPG